VKKFFIFLGVLIGVVIVGILVLGLIAPTDITVTRSALIKAPKDSVFDQVVHFKNWPKWSVWYRMDSSIKTTYTGNDGEPGSAYHWIGDEHKVGEGEMKNTGVNDTQMDYELHVLQPFPMDATGMLMVKDNSTGTVKVTWTLKKHTAFPMNAMSMFVDMDKLLGNDFESGLGNLKKIMEINNIGVVPVVADDMNGSIKETDYPGHIFEGIRKTVNWADMQQFFNENSTLLTRMAAAKINGHATSLFYMWDTVNKNADMTVSFPVSDSSLPMKGASFTYVTPSKAVMVVEKGSYAQSAQMHGAIRKYLAAKGKVSKLILEEYEVGPQQEPDTNKWVTNIYYLVK